MSQIQLGKSIKALFTFYFLLFTCFVTVAPWGSIAPAQANSSSSSVQQGFDLLKKGIPSIIRGRQLFWMP